ncbi:dock [Bugula neritina]|uniref:Dock n=1 Tax=Bugula neritina TaxID=10212 RepID=A0A7J7KER2_BUGNE|nr:dock [Bugula neritina]
MVGGSSPSLNKWSTRKSGGSSWSLKSLKASGWSLKFFTSRMSTSNGSSEELMVVAKYDYRAKDTQELNICKNEKLTLIDDSKHWWLVKNVKDETGYVPSNYVKKLKPSILVSLKNIGKGTLGRKRSTDRIQIQQMSQGDYNVPNGGGLGGGEEASIGAYVCAKYSYVAQQADELSFSKGDYIIVLEKSKDGWWKGRKNTNVGWFPGNYVDIAQEQMYSKPSEQTVDVTSPPLDIVITLYQFSSNNLEELNFNKDERLEIIEKPEEDPEWWRARNSVGKIGLVPRNYVEVLSDSTTSSTQKCSSDGGDNHQAQVDEYNYRDDDCHGRMEYAKGLKYESKEWFYGKITRSEAENWLGRFADHGDFLIRQSETNVGDFTVSVKASTKNRHFLVNSANNETTFKIGQQVFGSLDELIDHYTRHPIYRGESEKLYLVKPFKL